MVFQCLLFTGYLFFKSVCHITLVLTLSGWIVTNNNGLLLGLSQHSLSEYLDVQIYLDIFTHTQFSICYMAFIVFCGGRLELDAYNFSVYLYRNNIELGINNKPHDKDFQLECQSGFLRYLQSVSLKCLQGWT